MTESLRADVAVLGSGIAGFSVAEELVRAGKSVVMLSHAHSPAGTATALSSGVWDCGPLDPALVRERTSFRSYVRSPVWDEGFRSMLVQDGSLLQKSQLAFDRFHTASGAFDPLYVGGEERPALLPVEGGRFRAAFAAQKTFYRGDAMAWPGRKIGVVV